MILLQDRDAVLGTEEDMWVWINAVSNSFFGGIPWDA